MPGAWRRQKHRSALYRAQGGRCGICRDRLRNFLTMTLDHVVPRSRDGVNRGNLLMVHYRCNRLKGDRDPTEDELAFLAAVNERIRMAA